MAKKKKVTEGSDGKTSNGPGGSGVLSDVLAAGDYRTAGAQARQLLANPASTAEQRAEAEDVLGRIALDPGAKFVGLIALAVLVTIAALLYLQ